MSAEMIIIAGIAGIALALLLLIGSIFYRNTAGKRIREELDREYSS
ncbi:MAG: hypothetical protein IJP31_11705 [Lachnospiraceae bacterium]|nr:hypothetical protein [Lachnospiraceae bacterium]